MMSIRLYSLIIIIVFLTVITEGNKLSLTGQLSQRINHLLNITEAEKKFNNVLEAYITSDSTLSMYKSEIMSFISKFLSFQSLRPHIVKIYREFYTLADINGLIKFYSSALGKKLLKQDSAAEIRLSQLIKNKLQEQMPQITSWFQQVLYRKISNDQLNQTIYSIQ